MPDLNVRGVPEEIHRVLKLEAEATHRSLTSIAIEALREHAERLRKRAEMRETLASIDARRERIYAERGLTSDSVELLREDRER